MARKIGRLITEENYSPDAIVMYFNQNGWPTETRLCTKTVYRYVYDGLIPNVTIKDLTKRGKGYREGSKGPRRHQRELTARKSISGRPSAANTREEVGHWEMDTVVGGKEAGPEVLLVLTERRSRFEIIRKISDKTTESVVKELDKLERKMGSVKFRQLFKSITGDNGSEFMDALGIEQSVRTKGIRTRMYYAHPYCPSERGSNENANGIIRRFISKGSDIGSYTKREIRRIQDWMNNYPRRILDGRTAEQCMKEYLIA